MFTRLISDLLSDEELRRLHFALLLRPEQGALIRGASGLRKVRWGQQGRGKRGGVRVLYFWDGGAGEGAGTCDSGGTQMRKREFERLIASVREAGKIKRGEMAPSRRFEFKAADVRKIRTKLGLSQSEFALLIGVSIATLQNWEQGRRRPEGPARALLRIAATHPDAVMDALSA